MRQHKSLVISFLVLVVALFSTSLAGATEFGGLSLPYSAQANTCTRAVGDQLSVNVVDNITYGVNASEGFTVSVPGVGIVASYADDVVAGPAGGPNIVTVNIGAAYSVPANTLITVAFTSYERQNFQGNSITFNMEYNCTTGAAVNGGAPFRDARVNQQQFASAAIYCLSNGWLEVWAIDALGNGTQLFTSTLREINRVPLNPTVNTVIEQAQGPRGLIQLYRLTSGEFQLVSPGQASDSSKVYNFIFPGCIARR
ncbi:MAG: hypothetical protein SF123_26555 [Chloroflexota bacterium]|nr:hypothetical protein [Chloroflexota bacterium]